MDYIEKSFQSVAKAIQFFSTKYENLCFPMRHSSAYDLVGINGKQIDLIKVMRTDYRAPSGSYVVNLRQSGGSSKVTYATRPFDSERCDLVFVDSPEGLYLIPSEAINQKRAISLSMFKEFIVI